MSEFKAIVLDDRIVYPFAKTRSILLYERDLEQVYLWDLRSGRRELVAPGTVPAGDDYAIGLPPEAIVAIGEAILHWKDMEAYQPTPEIVDWAGS